MKNIKNILAIFVFGIALSACQKEGNNGPITFDIQDHGAGNVEIINVQGGEGPYEYGYVKSGIFVGINGGKYFSDESKLQIPFKDSLLLLVKDINNTESEIHIHIPIEYPVGTFVDTRDDTIYKTITVGEQVWMAENLRFMTDGAISNPSYPNTLYGLLYDWETALESCPDGWHLPSPSEWKTLFTSIRTTSYASSSWDTWSVYPNSARFLKSPIEWPQDEHYIPSGFNAYPALSWNYENNSFPSIPSDGAVFWTNEEKSNYSVLFAYYAQISFSAHLASDSPTEARNKLPCRCLQD